MARSSPVMWVVATLMAAVLVLQLNSGADAALAVGFYNSTCPTAESLVRQAVASAVANDSGIAAGLIRLHFHDCFVRGCDGSVLLDGNTTEKTAIPNNPSLRGFEVIDAAKTAIEAACPRVVSCADILAFAARDSAALAGNITWQVPAGRRDGNISLDNDALTFLPAPTLTADQLVANFANKTLTADEMVTLSGAHTIGRSHCGAFVNRLYNSTTNASQTDPTLSGAYADLLRLKCPANATLSTPITVPLDILTPNILDNRYYVGVLNTVGLLSSDQALITNATLAASVTANANNATAWADKFRLAMIKMGNIEVLEAPQGEIRLNCRVVNSRSNLTSSTASSTSDDDKVLLKSVADPADGDRPVRGGGGDEQHELVAAT